MIDLMSRSFEHVEVIKIILLLFVFATLLDAIIMPFTVFGPRIDLFTCQT